VDGKLISPTANIAKDLIRGYDGMDTAEDDAILVEGVNMSTTMHKLVLELDLGDDTMRAYKNWLKANKKSADEVSVVQYFIEDAQVRAKMGSEIDIAAFRGKALFPASASKSLKETVAGFRNLLKVGSATAGKVSVTATGAIDKANAVEKLELMYESVYEEMQQMGLAILVSFKTYNHFRMNYHNEYKNSAVEEAIMNSNFMGSRFHLGAGKTYVIPFAGMGTDDAVIMTPLENLAYLYDTESAFQTLDIQKQGFKHKILGRMPLGFGIRRMTDKYCYVNDRLIATS
jgi:hypothetical protein